MPSEKELAQEEILDLVRNYYIRFHKKERLPSDKISYAGRVYDEEDMVSLVKSSLDFWLTSGKFTDLFESELGKYLGVQYAYFVNSGSSANLLAFMALTSPLLEDRAIHPGDEVITVAAAFPTTVTPIVQFGAIPVFIDITIPQYNIDVSQLENAYSSKTKAVMIAHTLGNPFNVTAVKKFCDKYNLWFVEDNCDSLGSVYFLGGERKLTGTMGDIGTSSFYPPHHMTTGEGGAVYTNNPLLAKILMSLRDWGRDCQCPSGVDNSCHHRFDGQYGELPKGYDHKFVYSHFGYNLKATDMQGAIGVSQIKKLPGFVARRQENWNYLRSELEILNGKVILPDPAPDSIPSWFGFIITLKKESELDRESVVRSIEDNGVQTRMLFSGNIIKHPCFNELRNHKNGYRIVHSLDNTDFVMNNSFWVGVYPGMNRDMLQRMVEVIIESI